MGDESTDISAEHSQLQKITVPPMFMALAFGVAPPSLSAAPFASSATPFTGEERKNNGDCDCVEPACSLEPLGVASSPRDEACEASDWS